MTLEDFVSKGWQDHAKDAAAVFDRLPEGVTLVSTAQHLPALAGLATHVAGEHLGRWSDGIALLERLERLPVFDAAAPTGKAVLRSKAVLYRCMGDSAKESHFTELASSGGEIPEASDRIRILAVAASALLGQKQVARASADLEAAVALAAYGPTKQDPAAQALAVTANNLACELEELPGRSDAERALMLRSAAIAREFWGIAGGWMETERAEYRLAMSHLKAGNAAEALQHARACFEIVEQNGFDPGEEFFAREAIVRVSVANADFETARRERAAMSEVLPKITDEGFREYCAGELAKLDGILAPS